MKIGAPAILRGENEIYVGLSRTAVCRYQKWRGIQVNAAVPLERIRQAILLGCARKYVAWRNNPAVQGPISTLRYFTPILEEIAKQKLDPDYWEFLRSRIQRHEKLWIAKHQEELQPGTNINGDIESNETVDEPIQLE